MPTQPYYNEAGKRVPGVTTVIGTNLGWSKNQLMYWAFQQGQEGKVSLYEERDKAAEAGTLAHEMVEAHIKGKEPPNLAQVPQEVRTLASKAFDNYLRWEKNSNLQVIETELALVSQEYDYGGTLDAIIMLDDKLLVGDWKSSNGLYPDHLIQLAAYGQLVTENLDYQIHGFHLVRFDKEHADFAHHYFEDLSDAWRAFMHLRALHELKKQLERRTR